MIDMDNIRRLTILSKIAIQLRYRASGEVLFSKDPSPCNFVWGQTKEPNPFPLYEVIQHQPHLKHSEHGDVEVDGVPLDVDELAAQQARQ